VGSCSISDPTALWLVVLEQRIKPSRRNEFLAAVEDHFLRGKDGRILVVFSLGATISNRDGSIDAHALSSMAKQFKELLAKFQSKFRIVAVAGAGGLGRTYSQLAKDNIRKKTNLDAIGIEASRVNALLFSSALRRFDVVTNASIPHSSSGLANYLSNDGFDCVVTGGLEEGMTSDSTAASIAVGNAHSLLVIVSTVGGIFLEPDKKSNVKQPREILPSVNRAYLQKITKTQPKEHVLDLQTCRVLLSRKAKGMNAIVTGYKNIFEATNAALTSKKKSSIKGATRILL
jgi:uridylate kinase